MQKDHKKFNQLDWNAINTKILETLVREGEISAEKVHALIFGESFKDTFGPNLFKKFSNELWNLKEFFIHCENDDFRYKRKEVSAQRDAGWTVEDAQSFFSSIFEICGCPEFVLNKVQSHTGKTIFRVIDGNNRRRVFNLFLKNELALPELTTICGKDVGGMYYSDLLEDDEVIEIIHNLKIPVIVFNGITESEERFVFRKRNSSTALNKAERRNAVDGFVRDSVVKLSVSMEHFFDALGFVVYNSDRDQDTFESFKETRYSYKDCDYMAHYYQYITFRYEKRDFVENCMKQEGLLNLYKRNSQVDIDLFREVNKKVLVYMKYLNDVYKYFPSWRKHHNINKTECFDISNLGVSLFILHLIYELSEGAGSKFSITDKKAFAFLIFDSLEPFLNNDDKLYEINNKVYTFQGTLSYHDQKILNLRTHIVLEYMNVFFGGTLPFVMKHSRYISKKIKEKKNRKSKSNALTL